MYGGMGGAQVPNIVIVKEGEAIYCAVYGDLIDYKVYPKPVSADEVSGNYFDDGTHGDEVAYDGIPSNITENRDTYLGPFAIKYKNMIKKAIVDTLIGVMDQGPFAMLERARRRSLVQGRDLFDILEEGKNGTRDPAIIRMIDQAEEIAQNRMLLKLLDEAKEARSRVTVRRKDPLEFYRIPVAAESAGSRLVQYESVNSLLTDKIEDWTGNLFARFVGLDGVPYDDESYRFQLDITILQNQQGLGLQGYGGMYGGGMGGPAGYFGIQRAEEAAATLEDRVTEMPQ